MTKQVTRKSFRATATLAYPAKFGKNSAKFFDNILICGPSLVLGLGNKRMQHLGPLRVAKKLKREALTKEEKGEYLLKELVDRVGATEEEPEKENDSDSDSRR